MTVKDDPRQDTLEPTREVGDEGGAPGDVEVGRDSGAGTGSEAGETWRPSDNRQSEVRRDETGIGRRTP